MIYLDLRLIVDARHVIQRLGDVGQPELQLFRLLLAVLEGQLLLHLTLASHLSFEVNKINIIVRFH